MSKIHEALIMRLCRTFSNEDIKFILDQLDAVLLEYDVREKEHGLSVRDESEYFKLFFNQKLLEGKSVQTIRTYKCHLKDFYTNVEKSILEMTSQDIRYHLSEVENRRNLSKSALEDRRNVINSFYKWLKEEGYISVNPVQAVHAIKFEKNKRKPYSQEQMEKLRYACRNDTRSAALLEFLYSTGCRVSEIVNIKVKDVDFKSGEVIVTGKGNKRRPVYLSTRAEEALKRYLKTRVNKTDYLFSHKKRIGNKPLTSDGIRYIFEQIGCEADIIRKFRPHELRHTFATDALGKGVPIEDVQVMLGHERVETTLIYAKIDRTNVKMEHKKCFL